MRILVLLLLSFSVFAGEIVLDNDYVRVTRDAAPCSLAHVPDCTDRVIVALGDIELIADGSRRAMARGDIAVFAPGQSYELPNGGAFFEVSIKANRPPVQSPGEIISPEKNAIRHDAERFFVFEEMLAPGDTRARHSHSQRVVPVESGPASAVAGRRAVKTCGDHSRPPCVQPAGHPYGQECRGHPASRDRD